MKIKRYIRFHYLQIVRLKDTPYKVAKGVALGVALDFLPLPFISLLIAYIIAKIARFNAAAAVMTAALLKPAVFLIFWPLNILVGKIVIGAESKMSPVGNVPEPDSLFKLGDYFAHLLKYIERLGAPFLVGSVIDAVVSAVLVYFLVSRLLHYRQLKRLDKKPDKYLE